MPILEDIAKQAAESPQNVENNKNTTDNSVYTPNYGLVSQIDLKGKFPELIGKSITDESSNPNEVLFDPTGGYATENLKARQQNILELLGNTAVQISAEVVSGIPSAIGALLELPSLLQGESDFDNWFLEAGEDIKEWSRESNPIYRKNRTATFNMTDTAWWAEGSVSAIGSTLSLMIPGGLGAKGLSILGAKAFTSTLGKVARFSNAAEKYGKITDEVARAVYMGSIMRNTENFMEGYQVKKTFQLEKANDFFNIDAKDKDGNSSYVTDNEIEEIKQKNNLDKDATRQQVLEFLGNKSAAHSYKVNSVNFLFDIVQSYGILKGVKNVGRLSTKAASVEAQQLTGKAFTKAGRWGYRGKTLGYNILTQGLGEGVEEFINHIGTEEGLHYGNKLLKGGEDKGFIGTYTDPNNGFSGRVSEYLQDPHAWEAAFWGVIGGSIMPGLMSESGKLYNKARGNPNVDVRLTEITARETEMMKNNGMLAKLNQGINPYTGETLKDSEEEIEDQKNEIAEQLNYQLAIQLANNARRAENTKGLTSFLNSEHVQKTMEKNGVTAEQFSNVKKETENMLGSIDNISNYFKSSNEHISSILTTKAINSQTQSKFYNNIAEKSRQRFENKKNKDDYYNNLTEEEKFEYDYISEYQSNNNTIIDLQNHLKKEEERKGSKSIANKTFNNNVKKSIEELQAKNKELEETYKESLDPNLVKNVSKSKAIRDLHRAKVYEELTKAEKVRTKSIYDNVSQITKEVQNEIKEIVLETQDEANENAQIALNDIDENTENYSDKIKEIKKKFKETNPKDTSIDFAGKIKELDQINKKAKLVAIEKEDVETEQKNSLESVKESITEETGIELPKDLFMDNFQDTNKTIETTEKIIKILQTKEQTPEIVEKLKIVSNALEVYKTKQLNKINYNVENNDSAESSNQVNIYLSSVAEANNKRKDGNIVISDLNTAVTLGQLTNNLINGEKLIISYATKESDFPNRKSYEEHKKDIGDKNNAPIVLRSRSGQLIGHINSLRYLIQEGNLTNKILQLNPIEIVELATLLDTYLKESTDINKSNLINSKSFAKATGITKEQSEVAEERTNKAINHITNLVLFTKSKTNENTFEAKEIIDSLKIWQNKIKRDYRNNKKIRNNIKEGNQTIEIGHISSGSIVSLKDNNGKNIYKPLKETIVQDNIKITFTRPNDKTTLVTLDKDVKLITKEEEYKEDFYTLLESKGNYIPVPIFRTYLNQSKNKEMYEYVKTNLYNIISILDKGEPMNSQTYLDAIAKLRNVVYVEQRENGKGFNKGKKNQETGITSKARFEFQTEKNGKIYFNIDKNGKLRVKVEGKNSSMEAADIDEAIGQMKRHADFRLLEKNDPFVDVRTGKAYKSYKDFLVDTDVFQSNIGKVIFKNGENTAEISNFTASNKNNGYGLPLILNLNADTLESETSETSETNTNKADTTESISSIGRINSVKELTDLLKEKYSVVANLINNNYVSINPEIIDSSTLPESIQTAFGIHKDGVISFTDNINNKRLENGFLDFNDITATVVHEVIHSVIANLTPNGKTELYQNLNTFYTELNQHISNNKVVVPARVQNLLSFIDKEIKKDSNNIEELVTYAFTKDYLAKFLNDLTIDRTSKTKSNTFFGKLKEIILGLLENTGFTQLDKLNKVIDDTLFGKTKLEEVKETNSKEKIDTEQKKQNKQKVDENNTTKTIKKETIDDDIEDIDIDVVFNDNFQDQDFPSNQRPQRYVQTIKQQIRNELISKNLIDKYHVFSIFDDNGNSNLDKINKIVNTYRTAAFKAGKTLPVDIYEFDDNYINDWGTKGKINFNPELANVRFDSFVENKGRELKKYCK